MVDGTQARPGTPGAAAADGRGRTGGRRPAELDPRAGKVIIAATTACYFVIAALSMVGRHVTGARAGYGLAALLVLMVLQNVNSLPGRGGPRPRYWVWTLSAQALLTYLPFLALGDSWVGMPGFLAGSLLLWLPSPASWLSWGGVVASILVIETRVGGDVGSALYYTMGTVISSLTVFGLTRLVDLVVELRRARAELARLAVAEERSRVARDLHDLLGYSLSAITLKGELAYRLVAPRPERAREEITTMLSLSRQALADVRTVASAYRNMSLESEATAARAILASAGIETAVAVHCGRIGEEVGTALATVLREGVTNLLRHSKAQSCTIEAATEDGTVRLVLRNDGVGAPPAEPGRRGTGLDNLAGRLRELGGRLSFETSRDGWFTLTAEVPVKVPAEVPYEDRETDGPLLPEAARRNSTAAGSAT
ncbi:sensor histidine kinase [Kitasatospora sp. NPDC059571]|uniref:sensor histidine kinase n=1 Tax=Kitasatospora sp. NPDC059571 TaxID=3346871 RepID=UPI0036A7492E